MTQEVYLKPSKDYLKDNKHADVDLMQKSARIYSFALFWWNFTVLQTSETRLNATQLKFNETHKNDSKSLFDRSKVSLEVYQ